MGHGVGRAQRHLKLQRHWHQGTAISRQESTSCQKVAAGQNASPSVLLGSVAHELGPAATNHNPQPQAQQLEATKCLAQAATQKGLQRRAQSGDGGCGTGLNPCVGETLCCRQ